MSIRTFAGGSTFAHLLGRGKAATPKADEGDGEDEDAKKAAAKKAEGEGDNTDPDDNEDDKKKKIDDAKDEKVEDDDPGEADDDAAKKAKAAKAAKAAKDGDDESDEKDEADPKAQAARGRERARCAAIFATAAAGKRPDMAAYLAFGTSSTRSVAIDTLAAIAGGERDEPAPAASRGDLHSRMRRTPNPDIGNEPTPRPAATGAAGFAANMLRVDKIRRGENP